MSKRIIYVLNYNFPFFSYCFLLYLYDCLFSIGLFACFLILSISSPLMTVCARYCLNENKNRGKSLLVDLVNEYYNISQVLFIKQYTAFTRGNFQTNFFGIKVYVDHGTYIRW